MEGQQQYPLTGENHEISDNLLIVKISNDYMRGVTEIGRAETRLKRKKLPKKY